MSGEASESESLVFGGYSVSVAFCVILGLLGAWGSPSWFSAFPLRSMYRLMDALGAYSLSCATYFGIRYFSFGSGWSPGKGPRPRRIAFPPRRQALFALSFLPVLLYSAMVLLDRGLGSIDLWRRLDVLGSWSLVTLAALPVAAQGGKRAARPIMLLAARASLAAGGLIGLDFLAGLFVPVPGMILAVLETLLFLGSAAAALGSLARPSVPREAGTIPAGLPLPFPGISSREGEVVSLLLEGKTNQEIADTLFISLSTVKTHLARIFEKTGARNRVEVARLLGRIGPPKE